MTAKRVLRWAAPFVLLATAVTGVWIFVFRESPSDRVDRLMAQAREAVDLYEYARAEQLLQRALQEIPDSPLLHHNLATLYLRQEKWEPARQEFERAASLYGPQANEVRAEEYLQIAQIDIKQARLAEAEKSLETAIAAHPTRPQLHTYLIDLQLSGLNNPARADSSTGRFLRLCGRTSVNLSDAARVHYRRKAWQTALALARSAAQAADSMTAAHVLVAKAYWKMGRAEEGLRYLEGPMARYPTAVDLWVARGDLEVGTGRYDDALRSLDRALEIHPQHYEAQRSKLMVLFTADRYEEALAQAELCRTLTSSENEQHFLDGLVNQILRRQRDRPAGPAARPSAAKPGAKP